MLGAGVCFSTALSAYRYANGMRGVGDIRDQVDDDGEVERREELKKVRRRPLSETLQQLGEGRGMLKGGQHTLAETDSPRNLWPRLRGEEAATTVGEVRHRRQGRAIVGLKATNHFLEFTTTNTSSQTPGLHLARVYTISTIELFIKIVALSLTPVVGGSLSVSMWTKQNPNRLCYELANTLNTDVMSHAAQAVYKLEFQLSALFKANWSTRRRRAISCDIQMALDDFQSESTHLGQQSCFCYR